MINFKPAKKASLLDFFHETEIYDETLSSSKNMSERRIEHIKVLANKVQESLVEGFDKSGGGNDQIEKLKKAFSDRIAILNYNNLETMKESLSGTFLGLMIILGLSQKVHGSDYWESKKGWSDYKNWLDNMNQNIYVFDEEVKKILNTNAKA